MAYTQMEVPPGLVPPYAPNVLIHPPAPAPAPAHAYAVSARETARVSRRGCEWDGTSVATLLQVIWHDCRYVNASETAWESRCECEWDGMSVAMLVQERNSISVAYECEWDGMSVVMWVRESQC